MKKISLFLKTVISLCTLTFTLNAFAINEADVSKTFMSRLVPAMLTEAQRGKFEGVNKAQINYYVVHAADPKGVIIISPGQSESSLKYAEVIYDLKGLNYTIYIIDHRGQGESSRLLADPVKSHVGDFNDYVSDFSKFVLEVVQPEKYKSSFILAHSMGGAVAAGFLKHNPKAVTGVILSSPMFEINPGWYGQVGAIALASLLDLAGFSYNYAPNQKPYNPNAKFEDNKVTSSRARFDLRKNLYNTYPQLQVGGTTVRWAQESLGYTAKLRISDNLFQVPTLLFQAGRDQLVMPDGQNRLCLVKNPNFCKALRFPKAQHEILMETDSIRNVAFDQIKIFLNNHSN